MTVLCFVLFLQDELFMHLTNYSINKHNENFDRDESIDSGSKRWEYLVEMCFINIHVAIHCSFVKVVYFNRTNVL